MRAGGTPMDRILGLVLDMKAECDKMTDEEIYRAKEEAVKECVYKYGETNASFVSEVFELIMK